MKRILVLLFILNGIFIATQAQLYLNVNPFIGTGGHGHTFPGPTMPFGACQLSPDTRLEGWDGCSGYHYSDSVIYGFSHTHLSGTGCSDYGDILLMPVNKQIALDKYQYASTFSHKNEKAHAGYYQVYLEDPKVNVELTSTLHGGVHRYTYQKDDNQYVVLDLKHRDEVLDSKMEQVDDYTLRGYRFSKAWAKNQKVFFEIKFSSPIEEIQYEELKTGSNTSVVRLDKSLHCIIKLQGNTKKPNPANAGYLTVKCAISGVDEEGAHKNMLAEMPDDNWNFDSYQKNAESEWEKELSKIQIQESEINRNKEKEIIFYTALYHCMIHPSLYNDVDGRYRGRDDKIHNTDGEFDYYTVFSLWDTYRALHPLLTILDKKRTNDFINTFIKQYEQGGRLPIWELSSNETNCMIGYHVVSVIWDAYNKGIRDYDVEKAYEAMTSIATHYTDYEGEGLEMKLKETAKEGSADPEALESYNKYGYVRSDDSHESVSKTLEYAYDDWCIAQMAKALGKEKDYAYYENRSHYWMNVFDPTTGFMRARKNGCLYEPFSPYTVDNNFTEANAWQYSFYVPHEISQLESLQGGHEKLKNKLDDLFSAREKTEGREQSDITGLIGQYAHGNEPSHHIVYLYNYLQQQHKTVEITNRIVNEFYKNSPDGLIGNEDCGQMSAWYVFKVLGFYPLCPGSDVISYDATKPEFENYTLLDEIDFKTIHYKEDDTLVSFELDNLSWINHEELLNVKNHKFESKITQYGCGMGVPYNEFLGSPFIINANRIFKDSLKIQFQTNISSHDKYEIYFKVNNSQFQLYEKPLIITENSEIEFYSMKKNKSIQRFNETNIDKTIIKSPIQTATFTKLPTDRKIILNNIYNPSYSAGGAEGLMDGIFGKLNWRAGDWQGYQGQDIEVVMAFDQPTEIKTLAANFLEDQNSWIFYPKEVSFYVSEDSINWTLVESIPTNKSDHDEKTSISKFSTKIYNIKKQTYKYAKVVAKNFGPMPQWHEGRGNPTFVFIDEFEVN
jgi:predicted alpha-1,2-mannosidase